MKKQACGLLLTLIFLPGFAMAAGQIKRVSVDSAGGQGNKDSWAPTISADSRYVAFASWANNLIVGDANGHADIFVYDRQTGQIIRASVASTGAESNNDSSKPALSADGRFVAFESAASNLVVGDTNGHTDIFVYDRQTGQIERVSVDSAGAESNHNSANAALSADGRFVAFESAASNLVAGDTGFADIFVYDRQTGQIERVSVDSAGAESNHNSANAALSADGRFVAFESVASNLVAGDTNGYADIFVHDRQTGQTERASINSAGEQGFYSGSMNPALSADGRFVAFKSYNSNLVPGDTNGDIDVFVRDRQTGQTERVSVDSSGGQANNDACEAEHIFCIPAPPALSADGRFVTFWSYADNLVADDFNMTSDVFMHDRLTHETTRITAKDQFGDLMCDAYGDWCELEGSYASALSADGRFVAFESWANALVIGDTNNAWDVFVRDRLLRKKYHADISLDLNGPASVSKGNVATYTFIVTNNSGLKTGNVALTGIISNQGKLESIVTNRGQCYAAAVSVCRLGILQPGESVTVTALVTVNGQTTVSGSVRAAAQDSLPENNAKTLTTDVP